MHSLDLDPFAGLFGGLVRNCFNQLVKDVVHMRSPFRSADGIDKRVLLKTIAVGASNQHLPSLVELSIGITLIAMELLAVIHKVLDLQLPSVQINRTSISAGTSDVIHSSHHQGDGVGLKLLHPELAQVWPELHRCVGCCRRSFGDLRLSLLAHVASPLLLVLFPTTCSLDYKFPAEDIGELCTISVATSSNLSLRVVIVVAG
mmetsp:Transcript_19992/g.46935  ORF Transcript_19992/g.46935 Transcript_19992/m.46935 type:complete len:203 (-) Transcript_19992:524-1132(-)